MARKRRRPRPVRDPLLPYNERALSQQTRSAVKSQIDPIVAEINRGITAGSRNIQGVTNELAQNLVGYEGRARDIYGGAERALGAVDTQLADRLVGTGQADAEALKARLALGGQDPALAEALAGEARGASAAGFARGSAERGQLISQGAAAQGYAAKLPGIARLSGAQDIGRLRAQGQEELGEVRGKVPGLVESLMGTARDREVNKAIALRTFGLDEYKVLAEQREQAAETAARAREAAASRRFQARESAKGRAQESAESRRQYERELAKARQEYQRSQQTEQDKRRFENRQRVAQNRWKERQTKKNKGAGGGASGTGPKD